MLQRRIMAAGDPLHRFITRARSLTVPRATSVSPAAIAASAPGETVKVIAPPQRDDRDMILCPDIQCTQRLSCPRSRCGQFRNATTSSERADRLEHIAGD